MKGFELLAVIRLTLYLIALLRIRSSVSSATICSILKLLALHGAAQGGRCTFLLSSSTVRIGQTCFNSAPEIDSWV